MSGSVTTSHSEAETLELGRRIARRLKSGMVLALHGNLGTGKTVLARGIALGLGVAGPITSPTFTVVQEYRRPDGTWLYHLDMYRINDENEALAFGIEEYLFAADAITLIEWPERIAGLLVEDNSTCPQPTARVGRDAGAVPSLLSITLEHSGQDSRRVLLPPALTHSDGSRECVAR